ncbi:MAG: chemotaxis protein CheA, partial [Candidatus Aureabacteria bacterium]|nr:chemotaxis protein CheA [Candidatus Auribacterota bacterium]
RVDVQRLDNLMNYVGELVLCRNRLIQLHRKMQEQEILPESINSAMSDAIHQIAFNAAELQNGVMKTRMLPISKVFSKFQRLMRELEKQTGKEVRFQISGEETELDKTIIEEIGDPLIHLLRNAMDHGLESPDERVTKGKTRYGHIHLSASHQGNQIIIEIQDDGRGISVEKIRDKAIRQGLITSEKARQMSKRDILDLIFLPGFSTADRVTDLSGRGVGMDVVKNKVSQLKGIIEISTELNEGSSIKLKLPLTLAIIQVLLISVSEHVFALPLTSVVESIRISSKDISYIDGKPVMEFRGRAVPLLSLKEIYNLEEKNAPVSSGQKNEAMLENLDEKNNWVYIVIVGLAEMLRGIMVDYLIEQEEIVIKSLTHFLSGVQGFSGCTIMGDGRLSLIIDIDHLIKN